MQKSTIKFLLLVLTAVFISGFTVIKNVDLQQDQDPKKQKAFQKKQVKVNKEPEIKKQLDSVKKDNIISQKDIIIDTLAVEKGTFKVYKEKVHASYYAERFHGKRTASGKMFDMNKMTAAHKKLPFGTRVRVTNEANGKSVVVEITDRGPFVKGREIDLSKKAFNAISSGRGGYVIAKLEVLQQ
ncbi:MAG: septal ring lytic transglycosylase RlpA family protein [Bacteroidota bacterium]